MAEDTIVVVGSNMLNEGGKVYLPSSFVLHPKYNIENIVYDIGLIKISEIIVFNKYVMPISLANSDIDENNYPAIVSGWGRFLASLSCLFIINTF